jgi:hypothetical protein
VFEAFVRMLVQVTLPHVQPHTQPPGPDRATTQEGCPPHKTARIRTAFLTVSSKRPKLLPFRLLIERALPHNIYPDTAVGGIEHERDDPASIR